MTVDVPEPGLQAVEGRARPGGRLLRLDRQEPRVPVAGRDRRVQLQQRRHPGQRRADRAGLLQDPGRGRPVRRPDAATSRATSGRLRRRLRRQPVPLVRQPRQQRPEVHDVHVEDVRQHGGEDGLRQEDHVGQRELQGRRGEGTARRQSRTTSGRERRAPPVRHRTRAEAAQLGGLRRSGRRGRGDVARIRVRARAAGSRRRRRGWSAAEEGDLAARGPTPGEIAPGWVPIGACSGAMPAIRSAIPPKSSGASAWASERRHGARALRPAPEARRA